MVRNNQLVEFAYRVQVFYKAVVVTIPGHDNSFLVVGKLDHCVHHEFRISVALDFPAWQSQCRLENHNVTLFLQGSVERFVGCYVPNKKERHGNIVLIFKVFSEASIIQQPSLVPNPKIKILAVYKRIVLLVGGLFVAHKRLVSRKPASSKPDSQEPQFLTCSILVRLACYLFPSLNIEVQCCQHFLFHFLGLWFKTSRLEFVIHVASKLKTTKIHKTS